MIFLPFPRKGKRAASRTNSWWTLWQLFHATRSGHGTGTAPLLCAAIPQTQLCSVRDGRLRQTIPLPAGGSSFQREARGDTPFLTLRVSRVLVPRSEEPALQSWAQTPRCLPAGLSHHGFPSPGFSQLRRSSAAWRSPKRSLSAPYGAARLRAGVTPRLLADPLAHPARSSLAYLGSAAARRAAAASGAPRERRASWLSHHGRAGSRRCRLLPSPLAPCRSEPEREAGSSWRAFPPPSGF